jgi:hypothetical protein
LPDLLRIKRRPLGGAAGAPSSLLASEIAYNEVDDVLWYGKGDSGGLATSIIPIAGSGAFPALGDGRWVKKAGDTMTGPLGIADTSSSPLVILGNPVMPGIPPPAPSVRFIGAHNNDGMFLVDAFGNGGSGGGGFFMARSTGGDAGAPGAVTVGQRMGGLRFSGYGTTGYGAARAVIQAFAAETFTDAAQGVYFSFLTTAIGTVTPLERLRLTDAGALLLQVGDPTAPLQAVPKQYLDNNYSTNAQGDARWVNVTGDQMSGGLSFGQATVTNPTDMSRHISLHDGWGGFSVTGGALNLISGAMRTMSFQGATATMGTGVGLYLDHDPVNATEAVTLQYLQGQLGNYLPLSGGNLTGALGVGGNLTVVGASSFQNTAVFYPNNVAGAMAMIVYGQPATTSDTWAGAINFHQSGGNSELDFINLFSGAVSSFEWWQNNSANQLTRLATMKPNGDFYTLGQVILGSVTPAQDTSAASKWYVDNNTISPGAGDARWVNISGDTMTGDLNVNGHTTVNRFIFNEQNPGPMAGGGYGALTWNTDGGGDAAFVNGCNWASAGFSWYQVGASTWSRIMYLGNNGNLGLLGFGISYTLGGGGTNSMGFSWTGGKIHGWVDGNDQGALALESWVNTYFAPSSALGNYVAKAGDTMTGPLTINAYTPPWGGFNFAAQLVITGFQNNGIGIFDSSNANGIGIINGAGRLSFNAMPPLGDSTTPPIERLGLSSSEATFSTRVQVNADITSSNTVSGNLINSATGRFQIASNASYYFERNSGNGIWNIVDGGVTVFKVDPADRGGTGTLGNLTVNGATSVKQFAFSENNNGVVPPESGAGYLTWNASGGNGEVDFINAYSAYGGFNFLQVTGPGTWRNVFQIWPDGNAAVYGLGISYPGVSGGGNTMAFAWSGGWINAWVDGNFVGLLATSDFVSGNYVAKAGGAMSGGLSFGQATAPINAGDTSRHITLYDGFGGFSVTGGTINIVSNGNTDFVDKNGNRFVAISGSGLYMVGNTDINLVRDPSQPLHAATKQYVDGLWVINVKSYGATGNGSTDDTTAINNAVTAAGAGNLVFFPAGTYKITAPIALPTLVSVSGTGASSIIAPATAGQVAFSMAPTAITETHNTIHDLQISPTANNCIGIKAVFCNHLKIFNVTFSGCVGRSIDLDRCRYYLIENCLIRSSMSFPGGTLLVQSSTWNSSTGGYLGGEGEISNIEFAPMTNSPFGQADPCIQLFSQPGTAVFNCTTSWGAYASGPTTHILIQNQCQGNTIRDNQGEGVFCGIIINDGGGPNSVMPNYIDLENNSYDNVGEIGIFVDGTAAKPADDIVIRGGALTNMHCSCIAATVASGGTGFVVGNIIQGPDVAAQQQGNPVMLQVTSIGAGGAITGVSIYNKGLVQTPPANPVPFHGGSGSGATFNLTYTGMGTGIWLRHVNNAQIDGVFMENYGGVRGGVGMMIESLYNARITGNQITQFDRVLYCQDTAISNIVFAHNTSWNNNSNDFGGTIPTFSVVRDNIGEVGWVAGTPPVPASGVTVTNTAPYPMQIFIVSGSVSAITYMGQTLPVAATGNTIILTINRQHTIALTYTVAPGWLWVPLE